MAGRVLPGLHAANGRRHIAANLVQGDNTVAVGKRGIEHLREISSALCGRWNGVVRLLRLVDADAGPLGIGKDEELVFEDGAPSRGPEDILMVGSAHLRRWGVEVIVLGSQAVVA